MPVDNKHNSEFERAGLATIVDELLSCAIWIKFSQTKSLLKRLNLN